MGGEKRNHLCQNIEYKLESSFKIKNVFFQKGKTQNFQSKGHVIGQRLGVHGKEKEAGALGGIFLGGFVDGTGSDQVLQFGRSLTAFISLPGVLRMQEWALLGTASPSSWGPSCFPFVPGGSSWLQRREAHCLCEAERALRPLLSFRQGYLNFTLHLGTGFSRWHQRSESFLDGI